MSRRIDKVSIIEAKAKAKAMCLEGVRSLSLGGRGATLAEPDA